MKLLDKIFGKNKMDEKTELIGREKLRKDDRPIKVRFQSMLGEQNISMTIHKLQEDYKEYIFIDPNVGKNVNIEDLANMDIPEVIARPPSGECC